jgi:PhzF family phenazine biosynthesis protein
MRIFQVDAFTTQRFTGNPATVIVDVEARDDEYLAAIAREFSHAETAFVYAAAAADEREVRIRFFNARKEAAFVGHATIAAHCVLLALQRRGYGEMRQQSPQGSITVSAHPPADGAASALIEFRQLTADLGSPLALNDSLRIAQALSLPGELVHDTLPAVIARRGSTRLLLPVSNSEALNLIKPNFATLLELGKEFDADGFFAFALERAGGALTTHSRMFCPALGIPEDPVSGNAHAMLATYLWARRDLPDRATEFVGRQGMHVNRPGLVQVRLEISGDALAAVHIGGHAVIVSEGLLN